MELILPIALGLTGIALIIGDRPVTVVAGVALVIAAILDLVGRS